MALQHRFWQRTFSRRWRRVSQKLNWIARIVVLDEAPFIDKLNGADFSQKARVDRTFELENCVDIWNFECIRVSDRPKDSIFKTQMNRLGVLSENHRFVTNRIGAANLGDDSRIFLLWSKIDAGINKNMFIHTIRQRGFTIVQCDLH